MSATFSVGDAPCGQQECGGMELLEQQTLLQGTVGVIRASWMSPELSWLPRAPGPGEVKAWIQGLCRLHALGALQGEQV